jgi:hypothetical protein
MPLNVAVNSGDKYICVSSSNGWRNNVTSMKDEDPVDMGKLGGVFGLLEGGVGGCVRNSAGEKPSGLSWREERDGESL